MHAAIAVCMTLEALMMISGKGSCQFTVADVAAASPGGLLVYSLPRTQYQLFQLLSQLMSF